MASEKPLTPSQALLLIKDIVDHRAYRDAEAFHDLDRIERVMALVSVPENEEEINRLYSEYRL